MTHDVVPRSDPILLPLIVMPHFEEQRGNLSKSFCTSQPTCQCCGRARADVHTCAHRMACKLLFLLSDWLCPYRVARKRWLQRAVELCLLLASSATNDVITAHTQRHIRLTDFLQLSFEKTAWETDIRSLETRPRNFRTSLW